MPAHPIRTERTGAARPILKALSRQIAATLLGGTLAGAALAQDASGTATDAAGAETAADSRQELDTVVIRARNREERLQDVPIPVSVVTGRELARDNAVNITDFARRTTNVQAAELNSRRSSVSIRGVGKNVNGEEYEAAVGVIIDNVFQPYVGASWTNFADLENIEIARGPQGTLLGKNTTLGVLNVTTRKPSFTPSHTVELTAGERDLRRVQGTTTGAIVDDVLAYRLSFFDEKGDGSIKNANQNESTWYDRNRSGVRLQFLLVPSEDVTARIIFHHSRARENINMSPNVDDPATYLDGTPRPITLSSRFNRSWFGGYTPLFEKFKVDANYVTPSIDRQNGLSAEVNWELANHTLTSITAYKDNEFIADNDFDKTRFDIRRGGGARTDQKQFSEELRLTSRPGEAIDYQVGLYALYNAFDLSSHTPLGSDAGAFYANNAQYNTLNADAAGRELLGASLNNVYTIQKKKPETTSFAAFGQLNWHFTEKATLTTGLRQTWERKKNTWEYVELGRGANLDVLGAANGASAAQIAAAKAVRATQVGSAARFGPERSIDDRSTATSVLLSPSYKLNDNTLLYASLARGVKSGAVSWNNADGTPNVTDPETALDLELGAKLSLLDRKLILNVNLYATDIKDFQTEQIVNDPTTTTGTRNVIGNAEKVTLRGIEFDGAYAPTPSLTLRFGGAINHAKYDSYDDAPCSSDLAQALPASCDYSGRTLPGAPKYSFNLGADYRKPLSNGLVFNANIHNNYASRHNVALNLSEYGEEDARHLTDIGIGIGAATGAWHLGLYAKNVFDVEYAVDTSTFTGNAAVSKRWGDRRLVGATFRATF
ncbi:TonB-dependent receptor [Thauera linaloolentis]|uniref:TonB-dependent receptor plug n=1 Tax=Thauera linaloolentis (strain DSM 12138 / JCM 21573 / CCUG 41526 / CIP 105981 / IAM 15112 / NBRC 102519 / 47Lol) TaxID=1123367 RepID=N6XZI8_THAL4|nr:TonB-dependent receptor [Thauera linaloolentis]ENO84680.1 TonB-dependent receptor plug [Thauera linaloolentis 47Lol = DSM 12138]MCM8564254.1 TonB-dependent receptor [Thauera linaloolentis]